MPDDTCVNTPWWEKLPEDYYRSPQSTELDAEHPGKVYGAAAMDYVLRTGLASLVTVAMAPRLLSSANMRRELSLLKFYSDMADRADPAEVFAAPPRHVRMDQAPTAWPAYRPKGIPSRSLRFTSPYVAVNPALRAAYGFHRQNHNVAAQHWIHPDGPRPTLIFTHGYMLDSYGLNSAMFSLRWFYEKGYDILLYTLPFHGYRKGFLHPFSGFGFFANGFAHLNEAMLQSVYDLRILMNYLEDTGVRKMGISGLSLGGYISALTACADSRPAFVVPNAPAVLLTDMAREWAPMSTIFGHVMPRNGVRLQDQRHYMAIHTALTYKPMVDPRRVLIIGGAGDRFTSPRYLKLLHEHWTGSQIHWFPGNHIMHLKQGDYLRFMKQFMDDCCAS